MQGLTPEQQKVIDLGKKAWLLNGLTAGLFLLPLSGFVLVIFDVYPSPYMLGVWAAFLCVSFLMSALLWIFYEIRLKEAKKLLMSVREVA